MATDRISDGFNEVLKTAETPEAAIAYIEALEEKRHKEKYIAYWKPFDYQKKVFEAFREGVKILVICGGNRSGKTEIGAAITIAFAEGKSYFQGEPAWEWVQGLPIPSEETARNIWVVGRYRQALDDVIWQEKLMTGRLHPGMLPKDDSVADISDSSHQIYFKNKAVITGKTAETGREAFQSASVDLVWIDEECDADVFDECYQRTLDCRGCIIVTATPLTDIASGIKRPWLFDLFEEMKGGRKDVKFVYLSFLDNPIVPEEEKQGAIEKWKGHVEERARLYGEFVRRSGLIYPMWNRRYHLKPPGIPDERWMRVVSIDPAATGVTAALWAAIDPAGNIDIYDEYYEKDLVVSEHVKNILVRNHGATVDMWLIDPTWGTQRNAESHKTGQQLYRDCGLPVRLAEVGKDYGLNASLEYLNATTTTGARHPKVWVRNNLSNFIFEIEHYVWDTFARGNLKGLSKEKPLKRNDHLMNAWQYMASMKPRPKQRLEKVYSQEELRSQAARNSYF